MPKLSPSEASFARKLIHSWNKEGLLNDSDCQKLNESIDIRHFDWRGLAVYSFWIAIFCFVVTLAVLFSQNYLYKLLQTFANLPDWLYMCMSLAASVGFLVWAHKREVQHPQKFSNQVILFWALSAWGISIYFLAKIIGISSVNNLILMLIWSVVSFVVAQNFKSIFVEILALLGSTVSFILLTDVMADYHLIFNHLNIPLRFVVWSTLLVVAGNLPIKNFEKSGFGNAVLQSGLVLLAVSLWILSITGNSSSIEEWEMYKQWHFLRWGVLFAIESLIVMWMGFRTDNEWYKIIGIVSIILNIYTRYFEFFWNNMHKAIFFFILALSFWFIGKLAEKLARKNK
jgi:hypothetical protein